MDNVLDVTERIDIEESLVSDMSLDQAKLDLQRIQSFNDISTNEKIIFEVNISD